MGTLTKKELGRKIAMFRQKRGLQQHELGVLAFGYTMDQEVAAQAFVTKLETGRRHLRAVEIPPLIKALQIKCQDLFN